MKITEQHLRSIIREQYLRSIIRDVIEEINRRQALGMLGAGIASAALPGISSAEVSKIHKLADNIIEEVLGSYDQYCKNIVVEILSSTHKSKRSDLIEEVLKPWLSAFKLAKEKNPYTMPTNTRNYLKKLLSDRLDEFNEGLLGSRRVNKTKNNNFRSDRREHSVMRPDEKRAYEEARKNGDFDEVDRILNKVRQRLSR